LTVDKDMRIGSGKKDDNVVRVALPAWAGFFKYTANESSRQQDSAGFRKRLHVLHDAALDASREWAPSEEEGAELRTVPRALLRGP